MPRVVIVTWARNAEKTLMRAAQSIIGQTHHDWIYYLIDNDSTDGTFALMREIAATDKRVIAIENGENDMQLIAKYLPQWLSEFGDGDYLAVLDADDVYSPDFFMESLRFADENSLELVCCGSNVIDSEDQKPTLQRLVSESMIISGDGFSELFPEYYIFLRTFWAKLFSFRLLRRCKLSFPPGLVYGVDTLFIFEAFSSARRAGIMAEALHDYYVYPLSVSAAVTPSRIRSDSLLYERAEGYLRQKAGKVTARNRAHLNEAYFQAVRDTLAAIRRSKSWRRLPRIFLRPRFAGIFTVTLVKKLARRNPAK